MLSKARPSINVLGEPSLVNTDTPRYHDYAGRITHVTNLGLLRKDDPRMDLDPNEIKQLGLRSLEGLENAAMRIFNTDRSENRMQTAQSQDKAALIRGALTASLAQTSEQAQTEPAFGKAGILAVNLEKAALAIHHDSPNDPGAKRALTLAAAAHNIGASEASQNGFENGSVTEAAAKQGRDPLAVIQDLVTHKHMDQDDVRTTILNADIPETLDEALERITPVRPQAIDAPSQDATYSKTGITGQARRAEGRAMAMAQNLDGSDFERQTRVETATNTLAGAFGAERLRQQEARQAIKTQNRSAFKRRQSGDEAR